jgi:hypothetical protein
VSSLRDSRGYYYRGYMDGLSAGLWIGTVGGILFSILAVAIYHMVGR